MRFGCAFVSWMLLALGGLLPVVGPFLGLLGLVGVIASAVITFVFVKPKVMYRPGVDSGEEPAPGPPIVWSPLWRAYEECGGHRVRYLGTNIRDQLLGRTDDRELAQKLGWKLTGDGYAGEFPPDLPIERVRESCYGELDGEVVLLHAESEAFYKVYVSDGNIISNWNLQKIGWGEWEGAIPKEAFSRVWKETKRETHP